MRRISLTLVMLAACLRASAQAAPDWAFQAAYLNTQIAALGALQQEALRLNAAMLGKPAAAESAAFSLHGWMPQEPPLAGLPAGDPLRQELEFFARVLARVHRIGLELEAAAAVQDAGAFAMIQRLAVAYEDAQAILLRIRAAMRSRWAAADAAAGRTPALALAWELQDLVESGRDALQALRQADTASLRQVMAQLQRQIRRTEAGLAQQAPAFRSSSEPVLASASALHGLGQRALREQALDPRWKPFGRACFWHSQMQPVFGTGLAAAYNAFLRTAGSPLPPALAEMPWIRPAMPPPALCALRAEAQDMHLTLLLDASGSMNQPAKQMLVAEALLGLARNARPGDRISVVAFSGEARMVLESAMLTDTVRMLNALRQLPVQGDTRLYEGLALAQALAERQRAAGRLSPILLVTDGGFALSDSLLRSAEQCALRNTPLSVCYAGQQAASVLPRLRTLAQAGRGAWVPLGQLPQPGI
ncbi:MAG: VWA domain-containing protein [Bacteroidia bacterium]|nr:VWA domain-containing protein [Bacteroidia bacterium]